MKTAIELLEKLEGQGIDGHYYDEEMGYFSFRVEGKQTVEPVLVLKFEDESGGVTVGFTLSFLYNMVSVEK